MPMLFSKVQEALLACRQLIQERVYLGVAEECTDYDSRMVPGNLNAHSALRHCLYLVDEASLWDEARREQAIRWLGFVQGVLWVTGVASLNELKDMNQPDLVETDTTP